MSSRLLGAVFAFGLSFGVPQMVTAEEELEYVILPMEKPAVPPKSPYITDAEVDLFAKALKEADRKRWKQALNYAKKIESDVPKKIILWRAYKDPNSDADFAEIIRFIESNPDWPQLTTLLRRAEEEMPDKMPARDVIAWFAGQEPLTGKGKVRLGEAYLDVGNKEYGEFWVKDAWHKHTFNSKDENKFIARHKKRLSKEDHAIRINNLLWAKHTTSVRRTLPYLSKEDRAVANARLALMGRAKISTTMAKVPSSRKADPGLVYEQSKLYRRADQNQNLLNVLRQAPKDPKELVEPDDWWLERHIVARRFIKEKKYAEAYELAANHNVEYGGSFAEGEFLAGWLALRFLGDADAAAQHFDTLSKGVGYPISQSRAEYWTGRALAAKGKKSEAEARYANAAKLSTTYYGQLATEELEGNKAQLVLPQNIVVTPSKMAEVASRDIVEAMHLLNLMDQSRTLRRFVFHLADYLDRPEDYAALSDLMFELDHPELGVRVAKRASLKHIFLPERAYPLGALSPDTLMNVRSPIELVLGLSRQESEFNPRARSSAGALGLMQLMPGTAKITARQVNMPYSKTRLTTDPSYNVLLGSAHLKDLLKRWNGSYIMTVASYNAGPHRVRQWVGDYGDPRTSKIDPIDWIEKIPFSETRNYVQRVMENMQVYRSRIAGKNTQLTLSADIGFSGAVPVSTVSMPASTSLGVAPTATPVKAKAVPKKAAAPATKPAEEKSVTSLTPKTKPGGEVTGSIPKPSAKPIAAPSTKPVAKPKPATTATAKPVSKPATAKVVSVKPAPAPVPEPRAVNGKMEPVLSASEAAKKRLQEEQAARAASTQALTLPPEPITSSAPGQMAPVVEPGEESLPTILPSATNKPQGCKIFIPDSSGGGTCADAN